MNFESPDVERDFPGLYAAKMEADREFSEDEDRLGKKKGIGKKQDKKEKKDKGYKMFEEEDSEEELVSEDTRSPSKMKKHGKPSFKFAKKEKFLKAREKEKEKDIHKEKEKEKEKVPWKEDKKIKLIRKKKLGSKTDIPGDEGYKPIFGVALALAVDRNKCHDGIQVPVVFRECIDYIEEFGMSDEGIYRVSGVKSKVQALKEAYNYGQPANLHEHEPNIVASLLKQFLRELPEPVLTMELMPKFEQASVIKNVKQKVEQFQRLIEELPTPNRLLLSWTIVHMTHIIARESQNKMSLQNVSIVLSPSMQISHRVLNIFFTYSKILFRDTVLKRYVPPLKPATSKWSLELPESPSAIEEELRKQESLLNQLHQQVMKVKDADKEEQLWEVQRVVTQLKRKLKLAKKNAGQQMKPKMSEASPKTRSQQHKTPTPKAAKKAAGGGDEELDLSLAKPGSPKVIHETAEEAKKETEEETNPETAAEASNAAEASKEELASKAEVKLKQDDSADELDTEVKSEDDGVESHDDERVTSTPEERPDTDEKLPFLAMAVVGMEETESAEQILDDFTQMKREGDVEEEDAEYNHLHLTYTALVLEEEELLAIGDELREKIAQEQDELDRLDQEIVEVQAIREELMEEESSMSSASSSSESEDEDELAHRLSNLLQENKQFERRNKDLSRKVHLQRQICLNVKIRIRMIQQRRQEEADSQRAAQRETLMVF